MSSEQSLIDTERIIEEYGKIAFCNILDFYEVVDGNLQVKSIDEIPSEYAGAISGLKQTKDGVELKLYDKYKALEAIAKLLGIADDTEDEYQITVNHNVPRAELKEVQDDS